VLALLGVVGGAVDIGRGYMAQSRLQQACDAGALAARKGMAGETLTEAEKQVGYRFFDFNFPANAFGVEIESRVYYQPTNSAGTPQAVVNGEVVATVPTALMRIFGFQTIDLQINCASKMDIANADVAMVLDVTDSMGIHMKMSSTSSATESRLSALRKAVKAFYDALGPGRAGGDLSMGRIRYAFVPYGVVVNTGYLLTHDQMVDRHLYQSREAKTVWTWDYNYSSSESEKSYNDWSDPTVDDEARMINTGNYNSFGNTSGTGSQSFTRLDGSTGNLDKKPTVNEAACNSRNVLGGLAAVGRSGDPGSTNETFVDIAPVYDTEGDDYRLRNWTQKRTISVIAYRYVWRKVSGTTYECRLQTATGKNTARWTQSRTATSRRAVQWQDYQTFEYGQREIDVSGLKGMFGAWNNKITVPRLDRQGSATNVIVKISGSLAETEISVGGSPRDVEVNWRGCIEERQMDPTIAATTSIDTIPADAYDLNTNLLADPKIDATRWRPWIPSLVYKANVSSQLVPEDDCPVPALKLQEIGSYNDTVISTNYPNLFDNASGGTESLYYKYQPGQNSWKNAATVRNYIDRIPTTYGTLHDAGFIWGLHLVSGEGMFASENPDRFNGQLVSRNIVFMTDGEMNPGPERYVFSGYNHYDGRLAPKNTSEANLIKIHNRRLRILCEAAKRQGITVWVVAITDSTNQDFSDLRACASSTGNYKSAATSQELIASFTTIAQSIGGLRISQ
jgi:Flp pilus assembly protein TadG